MKKILIILFLFIGISCSKQDAEKDFYLKAVENSPIELNGDKTLFIVPGAGCQGCISGAEYFIKENIEYYKDIVFVFTNIQSVKVLRMKLGDQVFNSPNIYLDKNNNFLNIGNKNSIYPIITHLTDGEITQLKYVSPDSEYSISELLNGNKISGNH